MFRTTKCSSSGILYMQFFLAFLVCIRISSLVDGRMCLIKKVRILLVLITQVYHNARFKKCNVRETYSEKYINTN